MCRNRIEIYRYPIILKRAYLFIKSTKTLLILRSITISTTNAIASSSQHFCLNAAIEYPINIIRAEPISAGLHQVNISISIPNQRSSKFTLNHKYIISNNTTVIKGTNNQYNFLRVLISMRFI